MSFEKVLNSKQSYFLHLGDCLAYMQTLPDNSIDAVVTDPPYGLSQHSQADIVKALTAWLAGQEYHHGKKGFMSKEWDSFVPSPNVWKEVLRVLKPGGHILCAASTRTVDLMGIGLRLAGFEIRDTITELYDSDNAKADFFDSLTSEQIKLLQRGFGEQFTVEWGHGSGFPKSTDISKQLDKKEVDSKIGLITAPATEAAKQWQGFSTTLKPAHEPFILARKPIEKSLTIAENCVKWGTGAIDIDSCRVETDDNTARIQTTDTPKFSGKYHNGKNYHSPIGSINGNHPQGRFPANLIHDGSECVVALFPETKSGEKKPYFTNHDPKGTAASFAPKKGTFINQFIPKSEGSAARFFYCAKASPSERNNGLDDLPDMKAGSYAQDEWSRANMGNTPDKERKAVKNHHPTVKPIALTEYLIKLISREGHVILDPFTGSGTTGVACMNLNRRFIGCELSPDYFEIAKARINQSLNKPKQKCLLKDYVTE